MIAFCCSGCVTVDRFVAEHETSLAGPETPPWGEEPDAEDIYKVKLEVLWIRIRIRICLDPRHFGHLDPDPHQIKIRIRSASNKNQDLDSHPDQHQSDKLDPEPDPHQFADDKPICMDMSLF
jgi:hypothetical protein